jgi:hypothetical protein
MGSAAFVRSAIALTLVAAVASCSGNPSIAPSSVATQPVTAQAQTPAPSPAGPAITAYDFTYRSDLPPAPYGPVLGVASDGSVYYVDYNYGLIRFNDGAFSVLGISLGRKYATPEGSAIVNLHTLAIDGEDRIYTDAIVDGASAYLTNVSHPKDATVQRLGSRNNAKWMGFDLSQKRLLVAEDEGLEAFDDPASAHPRHATFNCVQGKLPCQIKMAVEGTDRHIYATNGFTLYELSESLDLERALDMRPYVGAGCACSIAPAPQGGVWFAADQGGSQVGYVTPEGKTTAFSAKLKYPDSVDAIATAADGSVWFVGDGEQTLVKVEANGAMTKFPIDWVNPCGNNTGYCPGNAFVGTFEIGSAAHRSHNALWYLGSPNLVHIEL